MNPTLYCNVIRTVNCITLRRQKVCGPYGSAVTGIAALDPDGRILRTWQRSEQEKAEAWCEKHREFLAVGHQIRHGG
jgi:hypothetical protein